MIYSTEQRLEVILGLLIDFFTVIESGHSDPAAVRGKISELRDKLIQLKGESE